MLSASLPQGCRTPVRVSQTQTHLRKPHSCPAERGHTWRCPTAQTAAFSWAVSERVSEPRCQIELVKKTEQGSAALASARARAQVSSRPSVVWTLRISMPSSRSRLRRLQSPSNPRECPTQPWAVGTPWGPAPRPAAGLWAAQGTHLLTEKVKGLFFDNVLSKRSWKLPCWSHSCFKVQWYKE